tara:strand:+ start:325 stop:1509 length:1185 start_codon:yes stop_codon:yes gene_type:complete
MPDATLTCIDLWIKAGSRYEEPGEEGIAHFLEHMVFKGGINLNAGDFDRKIEALGGSSNAATGFDDVHFYVLIPHEFVEIALDLLLNLILTPNFEANSFEIEREVVLEEIAQHEDQPDDQIIQNLLEMCLGQHAYARPILGTNHSIKKITPKSMNSFHKRRYIGKNCTIAIAGKIPNNIENILEKSLTSMFSNYRNIEHLHNKDPYITFEKGYREIKVPRLESSRLLMAWPLWRARDQLLLMGADIATSLLAEGRRSRLIKHLQEDLQIVDSIEMDITPLEKGGLIILEAYCKEKNVAKVEKEIHTVLKDTLIKSIEEKEIKRAHQLVKNSHCFSVEASVNVASLIGSQALWGRHQPLLGPLKHIDYWTIDNLKKLILSKLQPENSSTLIAHPE